MIGEKIDGSGTSKFKKDENVIEIGLNELEAAIKEANIDLQMQAIKKLGDQHQKLGNFEDALEYHLRLLKMVSMHSKNEFEMSSYRSIGIDYWNQSNYRKAKENFQHFFAIALELGDKFAELQAYNLLGSAYWSLSDYTQSLDNYQKLLILANKMNEGKPPVPRINNEMIRATNNQGNLYISLGDYQKALEYSLRALKLIPNEYNRAAEAKILNNIGIIYNYLCNYKDSFEYHKKALNLRTEINDKRGIAHSLNNIGLVYENKHEFQKALEYYFKSKKMKNEIGDKNGTANTLSNIGTIYINLKQWDKALEYTKEALQLYEEEECKFGIASAQNQIGRILREKDEFDKARQYLNKSLRIASEIGSKTVLRTNYLELYLLEKKQQHLSQALDYCEKYNAVKEEIFNEENTRKTAELKLNFEIEKKEKEAEILRQKSCELSKANDELQLLKENLEIRVINGIEENRKKDAIMIAQSRLATMGQMISFIAHQWKQPLNAISITTQNIEDAWNYDDLNDEKLHLNAAQILDQVKFMDDTITDFRNFFKPEIKKINFCAKDIIRKTLGFIEKSFINNNINIELELADNCLINGMPNELSQVILNILNNARDAFSEMKDKSVDKKVTIRLFSEKEKSVITFTDNAGGIPESNLTRIFDSYFSTKDDEQGTGLGLSMCKAIIEGRMLGSLSVKNVAAGAEFRIEL